MSVHVVQLLIYKVYTDYSRSLLQCRPAHALNLTLLPKLSKLLKCGEHVSMWLMHLCIITVASRAHLPLECWETLALYDRPNRSDRCQPHPGRLGCCTWHLSYSHMAPPCKDKRSSRVPVYYLLYICIHERNCRWCPLLDIVSLLLTHPEAVL